MLNLFWVECQVLKACRTYVNICCRLHKTSMKIVIIFVCQTSSHSGLNFFFLESLRHTPWFNSLFLESFTFFPWKFLNDKFLREKRLEKSCWELPGCYLLRTLPQFYEWTICNFLKTQNKPICCSTQNEL